MSMKIIIGRARRAAGTVKWVYLFSVQKRVPCIVLRVVIVDLVCCFVPYQAWTINAVNEVHH